MGKDSCARNEGSQSSPRPTDSIGGAEGEAGGVAGATGALTQHEDDVAIHNAAVACLANLAADADTRGAITDAGGAAIIGNYGTAAPGAASGRMVERAGSGAAETHVSLDVAPAATCGDRGDRDGGRRAASVGRAE